MLVVFSTIFVADTIIFRYDFVAPLILTFKHKLKRYYLTKLK